MQVSPGTSEYPKSIPVAESCLTIERADEFQQTAPVFLSFRQWLKGYLKIGHLNQVGDGGFPYWLQ